MCDSFRSAIHLRCFRHFRENIASKLKELHISDTAQQEILLDIFGEVSEEQHQLGLVDADDEEDYMVKAESLRERWDSLERMNRRTLADESVQPQFHSWFMRYKSQDLCSSMIKAVREKAGLSNEDRFYTNTSESINEVFKDEVDFKKSTLNQFVDRALSIVRRQEKDLKRAVCRVGDWRLCPQYADLEKSQDEWLSMSLEEKKVYLKKVLAASLKQKRRSVDPQLTDKPVTIDSAGSDNDEAGMCPASLSEGYEKLRDKGIHEATLAGIWKKAAQLVHKESMILPVPGNVGSLDRMVASTGGTQPRMVVSLKNSLFKCDCPMFAEYKHCSHTVGVAAKHKVLREFVHATAKNNPQPNLSNLVIQGMPKGAGKKPGTQARKRKSSVGKTNAKTKVSRFESESASVSSALPTGTSTSALTGTSAWQPASQLQPGPTSSSWGVPDTRHW